MSTESCETSGKKSSFLVSWMAVCGEADVAPRGGFAGLLTRLSSYDEMHEATQGRLHESLVASSSFADRCWDFDFQLLLSGSDDADDPPHRQSAARPAAVGKHPA
jgi:hypothetical protein